MTRPLEERQAYTPGAGTPSGLRPPCPWCRQAKTDAVSAQAETAHHLAARNRAVIRANILEAHLQCIAGPEMRALVQSAMDGQKPDLRPLLLAMHHADT